MSVSPDAKLGDRGPGDAPPDIASGPVVRDPSVGVGHVRRRDPGAEVNRVSADLDPILSRDGCTLYLSSNRNGQSFDIYSSSVILP